MAGGWRGSPSARRGGSQLLCRHGSTRRKTKLEASLTGILLLRRRFGWCLSRNTDKLRLYNLVDRGSPPMSLSIKSLELFRHSDQRQVTALNCLTD